MHDTQVELPERRRLVLQALRGDSGAPAALARAGATGADLADWRDAYLREKLPRRDGNVRAPVRSPVTVRWDTWGIPHLRAESLSDLYVALGYAMAQERLWQLDYVRRQARGRLAAILGPEALPGDRRVRIVGIGRAAEAAAADLPGEVAAVLEALAAGINAWAERAVAARVLPLEFDLLDYEPEPWWPADSIAVWKYRWWTLTGRLEGIAAFEAAKRILPPDLYAAFAAVELGEETIVPGSGPVAAPGDDVAEGSNNWVVAGSRTTTGAPVLCSDPHNPFGTPSQWFEAQLTCAGPGVDAAGAIYVGTPGIYLGRNRHVAWGVTNHTAPARDLFVEEVHPTDPTLYRDGDAWRRFEVEREEIAVRGAPPETLEVRRTVRGPVANALVPRLAAADEPPLSLAWVGAGPETGFDAMLALHRATCARQVLGALALWPCPPLNFVYADRAGRIGYHVAGWIPRRTAGGRGFRRASDPADAWRGYVPFEKLPQVADPGQGWIATANNVPWSADPHYLSMGAWAAGYRHRRIRERLETGAKLSPAEVGAIQADVLDARAFDLRPALLRAIAGAADPLVAEAARALEAWDCRYSPESVGASVFAAFWARWTERVALARFPAHLAPLVATQVGAVARRCLLGDDPGWFAPGDATAQVRTAFADAVAWLRELAGPEVAGWQWGSLHRVTFAHPLGHVGALADLLSIGPHPTSGGPTVRAAGYEGSGERPFAVVGGSTYRLLADLSAPDLAWSTTTAGQSAHPASPHYRDQTALWLSDPRHPLWMGEADVLANLEGVTRLIPPDG